MLTQLEKNKLVSYIKKTPDRNIYVDEVRNILSEKNRNNKNISLVLLSFFSEYTIKKMNEGDVTVNTISRLLTAIITFIYWTRNDNLDIDNNTLYSIRSINRVYKEYISRNSKESSDDVEAMLELIEKEVGKEEITDIAIRELLFKIEELNSEIESNRSIILDLENAIRDKDKVINGSNRKYKRLEEELNGKRKEIERLNALVQEYLCDITRLTNENKGLNSFITTLNSEISGVQNKNKDLLNEIKELTKSVSDLKKRISDLEREIEVIRNNIDLEEDIIEDIIRLLFTGDMTKDELITSLKDKVTYDSFNRLINKARNRVNIGNTSISINPRYSIIAPAVASNRVFDINNSNLTVDLVLTSDYHLTLNNADRNYDLIESLYDYCEDNNINLIINLGDFFGFKYEDLGKYELYRQGKELVNGIIETFPSREGIYHGVLGGNHDEDSLKYGYDSIGMLTKDREDIINLGYTHALVTFDGIRNPLSNILLHHIDRRIKDPIEYDTYNEADYRRYLDIYNRFSNRDAYIHLLGGAHISGLFSNFLLVPSLSCDRRFNGAMRLRIYFNLDSTISNIVIVPLVLGDRVKEVMDISYSKTR